MKNQIDKIPFERKGDRGKHVFSFDLKSELERILGVDITKIPGINSSNGLRIISETGTDINTWKGAKHFSSWLGLCLGNKISGGKKISGKNQTFFKQSCSSLRMGAYTLMQSKSYLGCFTVGV